MISLSDSDEDSSVPSSSTSRGQASSGARIISPDVLRYLQVNEIGGHKLPTPAYHQPSSESTTGSQQENAAQVTDEAARAEALDKAYAQWDATFEHSDPETLGRRKFRPDCPLKKYLLQRYPKRKEEIEHRDLTLSKVTELVRGIILADGLLDESNPDVLIADPCLEKAIDYRILGVGHIIDVLCQQFVLVESPLANVPFSCRPVPLHPVVQARPIPQKPLTRTEEENLPRFQNRPTLVPHQVAQVHVTRYKVTPALLELLRADPETKRTQSTFKYAYIKAACERYFNKHSSTISDPRISRHQAVISLEQDPLLTRIFKAKTLLMAQGPAGIAQNLIPIKKGKNAFTYKFE